MKGIRENLLLILTSLFFGACAPAFPIGQGPDFTVGSTSLDGMGQGAQPTDGTVGSQVEPEQLACLILQQFAFEGEPKTLGDAPVLKVLPFDQAWDDVGSLYFREGDDPEAFLPPCDECIGGVLRIISLGKFTDAALDQEDGARQWFNYLLKHETLDAVYGPQVFYQDFEITDPVQFSLRNFPFMAQGHYLFFLIEDDPDAFAGRGEKSLGPSSFNNKEEFAANLNIDICKSKGRIRVMRLIPFQWNRAIIIH